MCVCVAVADGRTPPSAWKCQHKVESFVCSLVPTCLSCHGVGELSKTFVTFCPFRALFEARFYYLYIYLYTCVSPPLARFCVPFSLKIIASLHALILPRCGYRIVYTFCF